MNPNLDEMFTPLIGQRIPGGCETCDAYQTVEPDPLVPEMSNVWHLVINHDDWCPFLNTRTR